MKVIMRVLEGPEVGKEYIFPAEGEWGEERTDILVGRDDVECRAHWRLSRHDPTVSRAHFILEVRPSGCYVRDNQSLSGVYLRRGEEPERRIQYEALQTGDRLRVGKTILGFEIHTSAQRASDSWKRPEGRAVHCICCGERLAEAPEWKPLVRILDFICPRCQEGVGREYHLAEESARERYHCSECGRDVTEMARRDGRAEEWRGVALYLCPLCGNRLRQQKQILGYWVVKRLGAGAMGEVYKVWHPETGRVAALKRMLPIPDADARTLLQFQREIAVMWDLRHPNIVQLYDSGLDGNSPVFVSEFVPGGDFTQFLDEGGCPLLSPEEVVYLIADALLGLGYVHSRGYVHRDLKLENLLVRLVEGQMIPKVADFGLARSYEQHGGTLTRTGEFGGTWMYMPPEQLTQYREAKPPVDIYAMGVVTYVLLSGYWPLPDFPTYAQIRSGGYGPLPRSPAQMVLQDPRVPLEERRPDLPPALCQVVNTAIAMRPEDRYRTAEEFRQALLKALGSGK